ncbi:MAG: RHS repeat domain-containing protein, partial [Parahaliea sp.]
GLWSTDPIWQASIHNGSLTDARTEMHYLHTDHLGTPILATTKAGQTSWQAQAEAFGAAGILPGNRIRMNLRLPGQYFDGETGLHYNYFRDYDPSLGRYLTADPIGILKDYSDPQLQVAIEMGLVTPQGWDGSLNHLYGYIDQNPVNFIDPTGLDSLRAALMQAIARGNTRQIRNIMDALSDPKLKKAAQNALDKFGSKADDWIGKNCKGSINREFPDNLRDKTLEEIRRGNSAEYKKAWKLLNDKRFQK